MARTLTRQMISMIILRYGPKFSLEVFFTDSRPTKGFVLKVSCYYKTLQQLARTKPKGF
ncbi:hypothetical protein RYX36_019552 [Vicia faba]